MHREFEKPEGLWRPVFDADVKLTGYQLDPAPKKAARKVVWRRREASGPALPAFAAFSLIST